MRYLRVLAGALLALLALTPGPVRAEDAAPAPVSSKLRIQVLEGDGAVHRTNTKSADHLTVLITDAAERPVNGATVSFQLPEKGPGGQFAGGLRTDVQTTDERGLANSATVNWNDHTGSLQVKIMAMKDQSLAGTLSSQYLTEFAASSANPPRPIQVASMSPVLPAPKSTSVAPPAWTSTPNAMLAPLPAAETKQKSAGTAPTVLTTPPKPVEALVPAPEAKPAPVEVAILAPLPTPVAKPAEQPIGSAGNTIAKKGTEQIAPHSSHRMMIYFIAGLVSFGAGIAIDLLEAKNPGTAAKPIPAQIGTPVITIGVPH